MCFSIRLDSIGVYNNNKIKYVKVFQLKKQQINKNKLNTNIRRVVLIKISNISVFIVILGFGNFPNKTIKSIIITPYFLLVF